MDRVSRYAKAIAKPGNGDALAELLLRVADDLADAPGCELYIVNRVPGEPDVVWVTELWSSQEALDAALQAEDPDGRIAQVRELLQSMERTDLQPVGGVGCRPEAGGFTKVALGDLEDMAAKFGYGEIGEARFAREALEAERLGLSLQRLRAGRRQAFGHRHGRDEELYVVVSGGGRLRVDDDVVDVAAMDAIRVAPASLRAFEAGPDGLELLAFGEHSPGDGEIRPDFWPQDGH